MKRIFFSMLAATSLLSCNKDKNETEIIPVSNAPKYKIVDFKSKPDTYTYDQYGRQVKIVSFDGSRLEIAYSKNKVIKTQYDASGIVSNTTIIELNADGLEAKVYNKDIPANFTLYEYNADKTFSKVTAVYNGATTVNQYYYSGGNQDSVRYSTNGNWYLTNVYEYYIDQPCVQKPENSGITWYRAPSKLMCKTLTHKNPDGTGIKEDYVYEYNAQGLVSKVTETTPTSTVIGYYTYY